MALLLHDGRQLYSYTVCDHSNSGTLRLLMTENEVLPFLVTESGLWMPEQASSLGLRRSILVALFVSA